MDIVTGLLCLLYGIFVSKLTQDKLKDGQNVQLPINESAVMKALLAEWISKSVSVMNDSDSDKKLENVVHCWGKTGLLPIWDVMERAGLAPKALAETSRLFPSRNNVVNSSAVN